MTAEKERKKDGKTAAAGYIGVVIAVMLDQLTKYLASVHLKGNAPVVVIPGVFEFRYLENESAAFGVDLISILQKIFRFSRFESDPEAFLRCKMIFFTVVTLAVLAFLIVLYQRIPAGRRWLPLNLVLPGFLAGAAGNLIDRMVHRYVIDFFYFSLIDFPIFNVADIYVTVSAAAFAVLSLFVYKEEDFALLFPKRREEKGR